MKRTRLLILAGVLAAFLGFATSASAHGPHWGYGCCGYNTGWHCPWDAGYGTHAPGPHHGGRYGYTPPQTGWICPWAVPGNPQPPVNPPQTETPEPNPAG